MKVSSSLLEINEKIIMLVETGSILFTKLNLVKTIAISLAFK